MTKGFWLTLDALLGLLLVTGLLLSFQGFPASNLSQTIVLQKEFDLFKVWGQTNPSTDEMRHDIEWLFPENGYVLLINGQTAAQKNSQSFSHGTTADGTISQPIFGFALIRLTIYH